MNKTPISKNEIDDQTLARQAIAGSREAFGELVFRHHHGVRVMLWRVLGDCGEVDDLAQEVFMSALTGMASYRQQSGFQTWLISIARNKAITHLRKMRADQDRRSSVLEQFVHKHQIASLAEGNENSTDLDALRTCMDQLGDDHRELVQSVYFDGQSAAGIARQSGQARNTIRMRLMRIRRALSRCIRNQRQEG